MNINTLIYIHRLLQADVAHLEEALNNARDLAREHERNYDACVRDGGESSDLRKLAEEQMDASEEFRVRLIEARRALRDFELHEWN